MKVWITEGMLQNWKTTVPAVISAAAGFVLFAPEHFQAWPIVVDLAKYIFAGGLIAFGISAAQVPTKK